MKQSKGLVTLYVCMGWGVTYCCWRAMALADLSAEETSEQSPEWSEGGTRQIIWRKFKFRQGEQQMERSEDRACAEYYRNSKQNRVAGARAKEKGGRHLGVLSRRVTWSDLGFIRITVASVWRLDWEVEARMEAGRLVREHLFSNLAQEGGCGIKGKWSYSIYTSKV